MKLLITSLLAVFSLALTSLAGPRATHVFIISFDQASPSSIEQSQMPLLKAMAAEGAHTWSAYTIVPSLTLPSHVSMLTGVGIQRHQILWNDWKPEKGPLKVPTIFSIAKEHGLVTALFAAKTKFKTLDLPGSLDLIAIPEKVTADAVAEAFAAQIGRLKPNLCFIHFGDPDVAGHKFGANSPEKSQALAECDAALKVIREAIGAAGLADSSVIILTADHGSHDLPPQEVQKNIAALGSSIIGTHGSAESCDVEVPWIAWGKGVKKEFLIAAPVVTYDTAATALWLLGIPVPESFWGRPVSTAFEN